MLFGLMTPVPFHLAVTSKILLPLLASLLSLIFKQQGFTFFFLLFNSEIKTAGGGGGTSSTLRIIGLLYPLIQLHISSGSSPAYLPPLLHLWGGCRAMKPHTEPPVHLLGLTCFNSHVSSDIPQPVG